MSVPFFFFLLRQNLRSIPSCGWAAFGHLDIFTELINVGWDKDMKFSKIIYPIW